VFITNDKGQVILDATRNRVKPVTPGQGFGEKNFNVPQNILDLIDNLQGDG